MLSNANNVTGSINFREDETEGLDIPFFSWGSILAATNIFADENKLGTGGFGSVYRVNNVSDTLIVFPLVVVLRFIMLTLTLYTNWTIGAYLGK